MHWRAGAAKERPASILGDVYACRGGYMGEGAGIGGGSLSAKAAIRRSKAWHPRLPRELLLRASELPCPARSDPT
jgi:hypothetical protein